MKTKLLVAMIILFAITAVGCSNSYVIKKSDNFPNDLFVVHTEDANIKAGTRLTVFITHYVQNALTSGHQHNSKRVPITRLQRDSIGAVEVIEIVDQSHAKVKIISGIADNDMEAEPVKD